MLERDKYVEDPVYKYFPNFSLEKYQEHIISMAKPYHKLIFNPEQAERWTGRVTFVNNIVTGIFTLALIPVIFYKKAPVLRKYPSKRARILWSLGLLFIPTNIANYYFASKVQQQMTQSYALHQQQFMKYRQTGDVTVMNPDLKFAQF